MGDDCEFLDVYIFGNVTKPNYYINYPCQKLPKYLDEFYLFKLAYHTYELAYSFAFQRKR